MKDTSEWLKLLTPYVPLFQTVLWVFLIGIIVWFYRKQLSGLFSVLRSRVEGGSSLKVGVFEIGQRGETDKLPAASVPRQIPDAGEEISIRTKKLLATLWHYQRQSFGSNTSQRWTFLIFPNTTGYPQYLAGLSEAVNRGWVAVRGDNHQCMLTDEGLAFIENHKEIQAYDDIYRV